MLKFSLYFILFFFIYQNTASGIPAIYSINWNIASQAGATEILLIGSGFDSHAFQLDPLDENVGNHVFITDGYQRISCNIVEQSVYVIKISTPPLDPGSYWLMVKVDGVYISQSSMCNYGCHIEVKELASVSNIYPVFVTPGVVTTLEGKIFSPRFTGNLDALVVGRSQNIRRVYSGGYTCQPQFNGTDIYYGIKVQGDDYGYISCKPLSSYIGNQNFSFIVDPPFGRSYSEIYFVDKMERVFMQQSFSIITGVYPSLMNPQNGSLLKIVGQYLNSDSSLSTIEISINNAWKCMPYYVDDTTILCTLQGSSFSPSSNGPPFLGGRGISLWQWPLANALSISQINAIDPESFSIANLSVESVYADYKRQYDISNQTIFSLKSPNGEAVVMQTAFQAPKNSLYSFSIKSAQVSSLRGSNLNGNQIFSLLNGISSIQINLRKNDVLLLDARSLTLSNKSVPYLQLSAKMYNTSLTSLDTYRSKPDLQLITFNYNTRNEIQKLDLNNLGGSNLGVAEIQSVNISTKLNSVLLCIFTACLPSFSPITVNINQLDQYAKEMLGPTAKISSDISTSSFIVLLVYYPIDLGNAPLLQILDGSSFSMITSELVTIQEVTTGRTAPGGPWRISYRGIPSPTNISVSSSSNEINYAIVGLFAKYCPSKLSSPVSNQTGYFNDFENLTSGEPSTNDMSFCGQRSRPFASWLNLPTDLPISRFPYLCYAVSSEFNGNINFKFKVFDKFGNSSYIYTTINAPSNPPPSTNFDYRCHTLTTIASIADSRKAYSLYLLSSFNLYNINGKSNVFYIDSVYIGSQQPYPNQQEVPLYVRGPRISLNQVSVTTISTNIYSIEFISQSCANSFDLLGFAGVAFAGISDSTTNSVKSSDLNWPSNVYLTTTRVQAAGVIPQGSYRLIFKGSETSDILVSDTKSLDFQMLTYLDVGNKVQLTQSSNCKSQSISVSFCSLPGIQPLLQVSDQSQVTGTEASVTISKLVDGYLEYDPIPTDMLFQYQSKNVQASSVNTTFDKQVQVSINNSPAKCFSVESCSITFDDKIVAPIVTSVLVSKNQTNNNQTNMIVVGSNLSGQPEDSFIGYLIDQDTNSTYETWILLSPVSDNQLIGIMQIELEQIPAGSVNFFCVIGSRGPSNVISVNLGLQFSFLNFISPTFGSSNGGNILNIYGTRFSNYSSTVLIGTQICPVVTSTPYVLTCNVPATISGMSLEIKVKQGGITISGSLGPVMYLYDISQQPTITSLNKTILAGLSGGDFIRILGSNFKSFDLILLDNNIVPISNFIDNSTIEFQTPSVNKPGTYFVKIFRPDYGTSASSLILEYIFNVVSLNGNNFGSWIGGSKLTIQGAGLNALNATVELIGDYSWLNQDLSSYVGSRRASCSILSSNHTHMIFLTGSLAKTILIENNGTHPDYGYGFAWSTRHLKIVQGDTVNWIWTVLSTQSIGLVQLNSLGGDPLNSNQTALQNSSLSTSGTYSVYFGKPGTYFFANPQIDKMYIVVEVMEIPSILVKIAVKSDLYEASYSGAPSPNSYIPSSNECIERAVCINLSSMAIIMSSYGFYTYAALSCVTPKISEITPLKITALDELLIRTIGLSLCKPYLKLAINGFDIPVNYTNPTIPSDLLTATIGSGAMNLNFGQPYITNILHSEWGRSLMVSTTMYPSLPDQYMFILPSILNFMTSTDGSVLGGAHLIIVASGCDYLNPQNNMVMIGDNYCNIISVIPGQITCIVPSPTNLASIGSFRDDLISLTVSGIQAKCGTNCQYRYNLNKTSLLLTISPSIVTSCNMELTLTGSFVSTKTALSNISVVLGTDTFCQVKNYSSRIVKCIISKCLPKGLNTVKLIDLDLGVSNSSSNIKINSISAINIVSPNIGSVLGQTTVSISGNALFPVGSVFVGGNLATILSQNQTSGTIVIITPVGSAEGSVSISLSNLEGIQTVSSDSSFVYSNIATPTVTGITSQKIVLASNRTVTSLSVLGTSLKPGSINPTIKLVGTTTDSIYSCDDLTVISFNTNVTCQLSILSADVYDVVLTVTELGLADSNVQLNVPLQITSNNVYSVGSNGGQEVSITGEGFAGVLTSVKVCNQIAKVFNGDSYSLSFILPPSIMGSDQTCNIAVNVPNSSSADVLQIGSVSYISSKTPTVQDINPKQGGTGGGSLVVITGSLFGSNLKTKVFLGTSECSLQTINATYITCITSPASSTGNVIVNVIIADIGQAESVVNFFYVDKWSSIYTWGGTSVPIDGDFVSIPFGKTVMLDVNTAILSILLIDGGKLFFDGNNSVYLNAKYILIINGGSLEIGTEDDPYLAVSGINLHGNFLDKELPLYGAKVLALRNGTIDIHGKKHIRVWTRLAQTAQVGSSVISLQEPVDWSTGDQIILSSTGPNGSVVENEKNQILSISQDGLTISLATPLKYTKFGEQILYDGLGQVKFAGKVGLLTHNVKIQGILSLEMQGNSTTCPSGFTPETFFSQSCLMDGNASDMPGFNDYGGHVIVSAPRLNAGVVTLRISGTELYTMGQAFRLGRYPIHFHMNGFIPGSYVKQCSIHDAFNRAVNIHNTHQVVVQETVAFNVMGGAFFLEDSIEIMNEIRDNLFVFVKASNSLLNDDTTPAAFWITNPNNIIVGNVAAGGSHFGFWYRMLEHPEGPSTNLSYCPRIQPLGQFENNEAHSQGWFGLWVHENFFPTKSGVCGNTDWTQAIFNKFLSWSNGKGAECVNCGSVRFENFIVANNKESGMEWHIVKNTPIYQPNLGPSFSNSHIIGLVPNISSPGIECKSSGVVLPWQPGFTIQGLFFHDFQGTDCHTIRATIVTCICRNLCGGYLINAKNLTFKNCDNIGHFRWNADFSLLDVDGSLSGSFQGTVASAGSYIVSKSNFIPKIDCPDDITRLWSANSVRGAVRCRSTASPIRFSWNKAFPASISTTDIFLNLLNGSGETVPWKKEGVTNPKGWMTVLIQGNSYSLSWIGVKDYTLFGYNGIMENFRTPTDYIIIRHYNISTAPDRVITLDGTGQRIMQSTPLDPISNNNGDVYWNDQQNYLEYIIRATSFNGVQGSARINFQTIRCKFPGCVEPLSFEQLSTATVRPSNALYWSDSSIWGDGKAMGVKPGIGDVLTVPSTVWLVIDQDLNMKYKYVAIFGVLEIEHGTVSKTLNISIEANQIGIIGGRLAAGLTKENPLNNTKLTITLSSGADQVDYFNDISGPILGIQAMGVFGVLSLNGQPRLRTWTTLAQSARKGLSTILLSEPVDWLAGEEIVLSPTGLNQLETETFKISSISVDGLTISLNSTLKYDHIIYRTTYGTYRINKAAEVGLITRNIVIQGPSDTFQRGIGARVMVSQGLYNGFFYSGISQITYVEFARMGLLGFVDPTDPRYALTFISSGDLATSTSIQTSNLNLTVSDSFVIGCSFHDTVNSAIGVFESNKFYAKDNVFHAIIDQGIRLSGMGHVLRHNLFIYETGTTSVLLNEKKAGLRGFLDIIDCQDVPILSDNSITGAYHFAISATGLQCYGSRETWTRNIIHSGQVGYFQITDSISAVDCNQISGLSIYSMASYPIYYASSLSVKINMIESFDNVGGIFAYIAGPNGRTHAQCDKYYKLYNSLIVGTTGLQACDQTPNIATSSAPIPSRSPILGGNIGIVMANFMSSPGMPDKNLLGWSSDNSLCGHSLIEANTIARFGSYCPGTFDTLIGPDGANQDAIAQAFLQNNTSIDINPKSYYYLPRPLLSSMGSGHCGDMSCDAFRKVLLTDLDGTTFGSPTVMLPDSGWQWDQDPRYGLGNFRIPARMRLTSTNQVVNINTAYPNKGVIRDPTCLFDSIMQCFVCRNTNWSYYNMVVESLDEDSLTRRISPIVISTDNLMANFVDVVNGPSDHGLCDGYVCNKRMSAFQTVVADKQSFKIYATATMPQELRIFIRNAEPTTKVRIALDYLNTYRLDVFKDGVYQMPTNGYYDDQQRLLLNKPNYTDQYMPTMNFSGGTNYYDDQQQLLYIVIEGQSVIDIKVSRLIKMNLNLPSMTEDQFFSRNVAQNLATFLGIPANRIRIVNIVSESKVMPISRSLSGIQHRASNVSNSLVVSIEISEAVQSSYDLNSKISNSDGTYNLTVNDFMSNLYGSIVTSIQTGDLSSSLGLNLSSVQLTKPQPLASSPEWAAFQQNISTNINTLQSFVEAKKLAIKLVAVQLYARKNITLAARIFDALNFQISSLGSTVSPWTVKYSLVSSPSSANIILPTSDQFNNSDGGWARNIITRVSLPGTYTFLAQVNTNTDKVFTTLQFVMNVKSAPIELRYSSLVPINNIFNAYEYLAGQKITFNIILYDLLTKGNAQNLDVMPVNWFVNASICEAKYGANFSSANTNLWIRNTNSPVGGNKLSLDAIYFPGAYTVCLSSIAFDVKDLTQPSLSVYSLSEPLETYLKQIQIVIRPANYSSPGTGSSMKIELTFPGSLSSVDQTSFINELVRMFAVQYTTATFRDFYLSSGSIQAQGTIEASSANTVLSTYTSIQNAVSKNLVSISANGVTYTATNVQSVSELSGGQIAGTVIGSIILFAIIIGGIVALVLIFGHGKKDLRSVHPDESLAGENGLIKAKSPIISENSETKFSLPVIRKKEIPDSRLNDSEIKPLNISFSAKLKDKVSQIIDSKSSTLNILEPGLDLGEVNKITSKNEINQLVENNEQLEKNSREQKRQKKKNKIKDSDETTTSMNNLEEERTESVILPDKTISTSEPIDATKVIEFLNETEESQVQNEIISAPKNFKTEGILDILDF